MAIQITVSGGYADVSIVDAEVVVNFISISVIVDIGSATAIDEPDIIEWVSGENVQWSETEVIEWS